MKPCFVHCLDYRDGGTREKRITAVSLNHGILSPYTAFVGVERIRPKVITDDSKVRHIPIQISKGDEWQSPPPTPSYWLPMDTPYPLVLPMEIQGMYPTPPSVAYSRIA